MASSGFSLWATAKDLFTHLTDPWLFMWLSAQHIPITVRTLLDNGDYGTLLSISAFCDALFGQFWVTAGPQVKIKVSERVIPLLEGRVKDGVAQDAVVGTPVGGTVIEIGAGSGNWLEIFQKIHKGGDAGGSSNDASAAGDVRRRGPPEGALKKIYGVEPHPQSAAALRQRVKEVGIEDIYEVIPLGIESLSNPSSPYPVTIEPGSVDCIVSILCLCSIPDQEKNINELYKLLKPGGRWYVYEHIRAHRGGFPLRIYQRESPPTSCPFPANALIRSAPTGFVNFFWSFFLGSCRLCCNTKVNLENAGPWSDINVAQPPAEPPYKVLQHIFGTYTK
jgi:SAM-dependent methyltransferase